MAGVHRTSVCPISGFISKARSEHRMLTKFGTIFLNQPVVLFVCASLCSPSPSPIPQHLSALCGEPSAFFCLSIHCVCPFFSLAPSRNSDPGSYSRLFSPVLTTRAARDFAFCIEKSSALSSLIDSRRLLSTNLYFDLSHTKNVDVFIQW